MANQQKGRAAAVLGVAIALLVGTCWGQMTFADYSSVTYNLYAVNCTFDATNETNNTNPNPACGTSNSSELLLVLSAAEDAPSNSAAVALAIVNNSLEDQGWDYAYFQPLVTDPESAYYYAGFAEGYLTHNRVTDIYKQSYPNVTGAGLEWVNAHLAYLNRSIALNSNDTYWSQVGNLFMLMHGIAHGFTARATELNQTGLHFRDIFLLNFAIEYGDVASIPSDKRRRGPSLENQHCSALIKVTPDDLFVAHDTWDAYLGTVRQYKTYVMPSATVSFSAMAGMISSGDDFYLTSNNLAVQETTNDFFSEDLYALIVPESISEFLRVMTANFLAADGRTWTDMFAFNNSGTYNNQYMVVNFNLYSAGQQSSLLSDGLLWIAEQIPGYVHAADVTQILRDTGYFASYNTPYFIDIYNMSGFAEMEAAFGPFFSYNDTSRAEIFRRQQSLVVDLPSMQFIMRYNEYKTDNESIIPRCPECNPRNSPLLSIASRGDLVDPDAVFPSNLTYARYFHRHFFGAVDTKITSFSLLSSNMQAVVINGPTTANGTLPIFEWPSTPPLGCPAKYDFPWVTYNVPFTPAPPHGWFGGLFPTSTVVGAAVGTAVAVAVAVGLYVKLCTKPPTPLDDRLLS